MSKFVSKETISARVNCIYVSSEAHCTFVVNSNKEWSVNKSAKLFALILISSLTLGGCANAGNKSMKDASPASVEAQLIIGQTTKAQVEAMFGSPYETKYTDGGLLIWTYRYDNTSALTMETVGSVVLTAGLMGTKAKGTRNELVVLFDENDVVKRFNMSNSPIEAGTGIF